MRRVGRAYDRVGRRACAGRDIVEHLAAHIVEGENEACEKDHRDNSRCRYPRKDEDVARPSGAGAGNENPRGHFYLLSLLTNSAMTDN